MKQSVQAGVQPAQKAANPVRRPRSETQGATGGRLAQLAAMANRSPRVRTTAGRGTDIQQSRGVQRLIGLSSEMNHGGPVPEAGQDAPVQRVRILLKDEDRDLMARVRAVPVANAGNQTLQSTAGVAGLAQIGKNETIVLEGHGYWNDPLWGDREIVSQGGIAPAELAAIVHRVPKPADWSGNVVLLGCATGYITAKVSEEYFKLAEKAVKVIGTRASIRVGSKESGEAFAGYEWSGMPAAQRPGDLPFVEDLRRANAGFTSARKKLVAIAKALTANLEKPTPVPYAVDEVQTEGTFVFDVDLFSPHKAKAQEGRTYVKAERLRMAMMVLDVTEAIRDLSFFEWPRTVRPLGDRATANLGIGKMNKALVPLAKEPGTSLRDHVEHVLLGYTLKEVDLSSNVSSRHSKRKRTEKSIFGDTWVDEP